MGRRKIKNRDNVRSHLIGVRLSSAELERLSGQLAASDCATLPELARNILCRRPVRILHKDTSMDDFMEELIALRKELNAIGSNINQMTRAFHAFPENERKMISAMNAFKLYQDTSGNVSRLLEIIGQLSEKWLRK